MIAYTVANVPKWNPINVCSYHLQEAGATPVQEVAFALCTAIAVLDVGARLRARCRRTSSARSSRASRSSSTPACGSSRRCASCARSASCGTRSPASATASPNAEAAPVPLRRAGQLARAHRGAAGEQRLAHPARDARRHAVEGRPRARGAAAGLERGARPAAAVGSAVVAAHAAGARLRVRPARVRRPVRRARRSSRPRSTEITAGARAEIDTDPRDGRRGGRGRVRLPEVGAGLARWPRAGAGSSPARTSSSASTSTPRPSRTRSSAAATAAS